MSSTAPAQTKTLRWILNGPSLAAFAADSTASHFLNGSQPFVMQRKTRQMPIPAQWNAVSVRSFSSFDTLKRAFATGAIGPEVGAILYDNEHWKFTPLEEQRNVATYTQRAADLVHAHRLTFIATPAVNLTRVLAPGSTSERYERFLQLGVIAASARYADVVDIQAQGTERNVDMFERFVTAAAQQARQANPRVLVFAGISTNPSGQRVSADNVMQAVNATRSVVDGYWFNVPQRSAYCPNCSDFRPDIAVEVFRRLLNGTP